LNFRDAYTLMPTMALAPNGAVKNNKIRVAFYWCCAAVLAGLDPPAELMALDPFISDIFHELCDAVKVGSEVETAHVLEKHAYLLETRAVYLLLHPLRLAASLCLLQQVQQALTLLQTSNPELEADPARVNLVTFAKCYARVNHIHVLRSTHSARKDRRRESDSAVAAAADAEEADDHGVEMGTAVEEVHEDDLVDRVCLIIANLIGRKWVKGYISYEHKTLVLSRADPFPAPALFGDMEQHWRLHQQRSQQAQQRGARARTS
jgi:hypothetical protein